MLALDRMKDIRSRYPANDDLMQNATADKRSGITTRDLEAPIATYSKHTEQQIKNHNESIHDNRSSMLSNVVHMNQHRLSKGEKVNAYIAGKQLSLTKEQLSIAKKQAATLVQINGVLREMSNRMEREANKMDPKYQHQSSFNAHDYSYARGRNAANDDKKPSVAGKTGDAIGALGSAIAGMLGIGAGAVAGKSIFDRIRNRGRAPSTPPGTPPRPGTPPARGGWARRAQDAWRSTAGVKGGRGALLTRGAAVVAAGVGINQLSKDITDPFRGIPGYKAEDSEPTALFMPSSGSTLRFPDVTRTEPTVNERPHDAQRNISPIGTVSQNEESQRGVFEISSGRGDRGGVSYGAHQLSSETGTMRSFLLSEQGKPYQFAFRDVRPGTPAFNEVYKKVAEHDPKGFAAAQKEYIDRTHYKPMHDRLSNDLGIDLRGRGRAVQEMVYSTSVQYGPSTTVMRNALLGKSVNSMTDAEIIKTVQQYKHDTTDRYFTSSSADVRRSIARRTLRERDTLLDIDRQERETNNTTSSSNDESSDTYSTVTATSVVKPDDSSAFNIDNSTLATVGAVGSIGVLPLVGRANASAPLPNVSTPALPPPVNNATPKVPTPRTGPARLGRALPYAGAALTAYDAYSVLSDPELTREEKKREMSGVVGGTAGAAGGAALGAAIGSAFFGVGAIPGAVIGGGLGMLGYGLGNKVGKTVYDHVDSTRPLPNTMPVSTMDDLTTYTRPVNGAVPAESRIPIKVTENIMDLGGVMPKSVRSSVNLDRVEPARTSTTLPDTDNIERRREDLRESMSSFTETTDNTLYHAGISISPTSVDSSDVHSPVTVTNSLRTDNSTRPSNTNVASTYNSTRPSSNDRRTTNSVTNQNIKDSHDSPIDSVISGSLSTIMTSILGYDVSSTGMRAGHIPHVTARSEPPEPRTGTKAESINITPSVDSPSSKHYYEDGDISTSATSVSNTNVTSRPVAPKSTVSSAGSYTAPAEQTPYEPIKSVMMFEPKVQETLMPKRFKPEGERIPSRGVSSAASSRQVIDDAPAVISDSGLVLLHTGFI